MIKIGIVNYGVGNLKSVFNAVKHCGYEAKIVTRPQELNHFNKLILPGVGAFDHAMRCLTQHGLDEAITSWVKIETNHLLGICLGMQLLCSSSEESTSGAMGLNLINAKVKKLSSTSTSRLPNIGWSPVEFRTSKLTNFSGDYYLVHSYGAFCLEPESELAQSHYGETPFSSAITNGKNIVGYQFHPEKSHLLGLSLIKSFCCYD